MHEIPISMLYSKVVALNVPCNRVGIRQWGILFFICISPFYFLYLFTITSTRLGLTCQDEKLPEHVREAERNFKLNTKVRNGERTSCNELNFNCPLNNNTSY
jgi:hypothetical protein